MLDEVRPAACKGVTETASKTNVEMNGRTKMVLPIIEKPSV
jgi:hypothetical protein